MLIYTYKVNKRGENMNTKYNPSNCEFVEDFKEHEIYIHTPTGDKIIVPLILHNSYWVVTRDWANAEIVTEQTTESLKEKRGYNLDVVSFLEEEEIKRQKC